MNHYSDTELLRLTNASLSRHEAQQFFDHLDECPDCRSRYGQLIAPVNEQSIEPLSTAEKEELYAALQPEIVIRDFKLRSDRVSGRIIRSWHVVASAGVALAATLLLTVLPSVKNHTPGQPGTFPATGTASVTAVVPTFELSAVSGNAKINNNSIAATGLRSTDSTGTVVTGESGSATLIIAGVLTLRCPAITDLTWSLRDPRRIDCTLRGTLDGELIHQSGHTVRIAVTGGTYTIVGTIFSITSDSLGSSIFVKQGTVVYSWASDTSIVDSITTGQHKSYRFEAKSATVNRRVATPDKSLPTASITEPTVSPTSEKQPDPMFIARQLIRLRKPLEAVTELIRSFGPSSTTPDSALWLKALSFEQAGAYDSAMGCYEQFSKRPASLHAAPAIRATARIQWASQNFDLARTTYEHYLTLTGDKGTYRDEAFEAVVSYYVKSSDFTSQRGWLTRWMDNSPELHTPVYLLATVYRERSDYQFAVRYYNTYILKYPQGPWREEAHYWAAICYDNLGLAKEYAQTVQKYKEQYPAGQWLVHLSRK